MKKWLVTYSLEIFATMVLLVVLAVMLFVPEISYMRTLALGFAILAVLHEYEEKRVPGGFFDLMAKKFGMNKETTNVDLAGFFVICYWLVLIVLPFVFDDCIALLVMPIVLGFFEAFIHTAGIWIHKMRRPYTPGLASAWLMAGLSLWSVHYLNTATGATGTDYLIGTVLMAIGFALLECGTLYAANMTFKDVGNKMITTLKSGKANY